MSRSVGEFILLGHLGEGSFATVSHRKLALDEAFFRSTQAERGEYADRCLSVPRFANNTYSGKLSTGDSTVR